ncbi:MAG: hypothetical protein AAF492_02505 [Verrucomicrobiota bacterium]
MNEFWLGFSISMVLSFGLLLPEAIAGKGFVRSLHRFVAWLPFNVCASFMGGFAVKLFLQSTMNFGDVVAVSVGCLGATLFLGQIAERKISYLGIAWKENNVRKVHWLSTGTWFVAALISTIPFWFALPHEPASRVTQIRFSQAMISAGPVILLLTIFYFVFWKLTFNSLKKDLKERIDTLFASLVKPVPVYSHDRDWLLVSEKNDIESYGPFCNSKYQVLMGIPPFRGVEQDREIYNESLLPRLTVKEIMLAAQTDALAEVTNVEWIVKLLCEEGENTAREAVNSLLVALGDNDFVQRCAERRKDLLNCAAALRRLDEESARSG